MKRCAGRDQPTTPHPGRPAPPSGSGSGPACADGGGPPEPLPAWALGSERHEDRADGLLTMARTLPRLTRIALALAWRADRTALLRLAGLQLAAGALSAVALHLTRTALTGRNAR
ncbi:hypothetical protein ACIQXD_35190 [Streptomyces uncialis]|uniref:hypothetical protein n=1 Tax=Streptomyces uncialis TaxID=1048205 RepID=UPI0037F562BD